MVVQRQKLSSLLNKCILVLGVILCSFHLTASWMGTFTAMRQRTFHVGVVLIIALLANLTKKLNDEQWKPNRFQITYEVISSAFILASATVTLFYLYIYDAELVMHIGRPTTLDYVLGICLLISLLEVTRRNIGWIMPGIAILFVLYARFGSYLPAAMANKGYSWKRIATYLLLSDSGIYGTPVGVSATVVIMFIIFGAFLQYSGAGKAFIDLAFSIFGRFRGGPAKVAVVASALFGMINGSAIANVASTGSLTIPLMKKVGYEPEVAGAVSAVASTGGQIMPPIMGAAAFVMAQNLAMPYRDIAISAAIPSALYFFQIFLVVDLLAVKSGLKGLPAAELPDGKKVLKYESYLLLPIIALVVMMVGFNVSSNKSALFACIFTIVVSWFNKTDKMLPKEIALAFGQAAREICSVALACATAGVAIGMLGLTGLGLKISSILVALSGGNLYILMILTMVAGIILGMGLPTSGVYLILAVLGAPALVELGVPAFSAHMFVFYFGVIAAITPPVALASYAGAGIAKGDANKTGWQAVKIGLAGFILPYMFILRPSILGQGSAFAVFQTTIIATIAIIAIVCGMYAMPSKNKIVRALLGISAIVLLTPGTITDFVGITLVVGSLAYSFFIEKRRGVLA
ncbi:TRAP transporter permease [Geosporobacter ferrireducens]|uniref:TRAP transporter permease n=1 Tax=Geosporobacter ferrireducens TaxID=1424294 RepID=UPI00139D2FF2|nr:TRAP transporter permease [Geosporobacter ferrireducens]MTI56610.1 TRAP transporter permease [Geosporobacter ferrireducens]